MGPWSEHGNAWYTCNRYDEKESVEARDSQSKSRASLERYLFVSGRHLMSMYRLMVSLVLQSLRQPRAIRQTIPGPLYQDRKEDGRNANHL
jgi:hypothetical protein